MACVNNMSITNGDYEREEGEIVDELDDLSDISSEEEYLLRQRLQVLENYNHVLERKEAKRSSFRSEAYPRVAESPVIRFEKKSTSSNKYLEEKASKTVHYRNNKQKVFLQEPITHKSKDKRRKPYRQKKKPEIKITKNDSSDESDYEYRNKRRKLANAVLVTKNKTDTSLKARLFQMLGSGSNHSGDLDAKPVDKDVYEVSDGDVKDDLIVHTNQPVPSKVVIEDVHIIDHTSEKIFPIEGLDSINLTSDEESLQIVPSDKSIQNEGNDVVDGGMSFDIKKQENNEAGSEDDLELLRQHALKSKVPKVSEVTQEECDVNKPVILLSDDEDSDTAELRLICLRSALLKKAIEMKRKQKQRKRHTHSTSLFEDVMSNELNVPDNNNDPDNNTDIESVDMDIGSDDYDDKINKILDKNNRLENVQEINEKVHKPERKLSKEEEIEEDEDLLRAKLLTSLSKNLPPLADLNPVETEISAPAEVKSKDNSVFPVSTEDKSKTEEKRFIIHTGDSDSDGEHEVTKNLTKMHLKLSEQPDFQQKLDIFLKSARMEVEKTELPDGVQKPQEQLTQEPDQKFVPKTLNHLPKNEQIEYKNLVKRMAELEKIKKARQVSIHFWNKELNSAPVISETLKPRNVTTDTVTPLTQSVLDEEIALSRKKIAEESAKVLQLKEKQSNLSQKYKIVATELRNISTAIALNKKQQKSAQIQLSRIRAQHQMLLKRCSTVGYNFANRSHSKVNPSSKLQKENEPLINKHYDRIDLKSVKVSVVNDLKEAMKPQVSNDNLMIQLDVISNKKAVKMPKSNTSTKQDIEQHSAEQRTAESPVERIVIQEKERDSADDYQSPLQALSASWKEDPNGVLCPFDVSGSCKDTNCKYLHPKHTTH